MSDLLTPAFTAFQAATAKIEGELPKIKSEHEAKVQVAQRALDQALGDAERAPQKLIATTAFDLEKALQGLYPTIETAISTNGLTAPIAKRLGQLQEIANNTQGKDLSALQSEVLGFLTKLANQFPEVKQLLFPTGTGEF